ncbi:MAG: signal peptidase I [Candidatus Dormibacter sp.]
MAISASSLGTGVADPSLGSRARPGDVPAAATPRATPATRAHLRGALRHGGNLAFAALATALVMFASLIVAGAVTRHHFEQVITASMVPTIPVGSLVVTEHVTASSLVVGNVLVFTKPTNVSEVIVHRIASITRASDGSILVQTKGDANHAPDPWLIKQSAAGAADRAVYVMPGLGTVASQGRSVLILLLPALLITYLVSWSRRRYRAMVGTEA